MITTSISRAHNVVQQLHWSCNENTRDQLCEKNTNTEKEKYTGELVDKRLFTLDQVCRVISPSLLPLTHLSPLLYLAFFL